MPSLFKKCSKCKKTKSISDFSSSSVFSDGVRPWCKKCVVEYNKEYLKNDEHRLKAVWRGMKFRCYDNRSDSYRNYGKKGIGLSNEWLNFENFKRDMLAGYKKGLYIDRIDNNKGYCRENCRWVTPKESALNRAGTHLLSYGGKKMTLSDWARKLNVNRSTLSQRYYVYKWSIKKTLTYNT